jgi:hypothetical protein
LTLGKNKPLWRRKMLAVTLTIGTLVSIMFFFVGGVVGWLAKEHFYQTQPVFTHPEMFDSNGNIIPDEILAVRFENDYFDCDEDDEQED